jgi:hypothetical protein
VSDVQLVDGLVIIFLRIRDVEAREQIIHHLCDIGEQITPTIYELNTSDWDAGLWEDEVKSFERFLEGTRDRMIVWRILGQTYTRLTITGSA